MATWPTAHNALVVEESFKRIAAHADLITERFYAKVFDAAPEVRQLFPDDMRVQRNKIIELFAFIVNNLDKPDELKQRLVGLGQRHQTYGVHKVHFFVVRAALLETLRECEEIRLTPAERQEWDHLFCFMAAGMGVNLPSFS
ncbi:MAG: hypothetical protein JSS65_04360 [Armatimonadetes bacterium]|nr:hypothetical protein [Armatimonadota bacterium]